MTKQNAQLGTFENLERQYREKSNGTSHGKEFEKLVKYFLENEPLYQSKLKKVWLWEEWPKPKGWWRSKR